MGTGTEKESEARHESLAQAPGIRDEFRNSGSAQNLSKESRNCDIINDLFSNGCAIINYSFIFKINAACSHSSGYICTNWFSGRALVINAKPSKRVTFSFFRLGLVSCMCLVVG